MAIVAKIESLMDALKKIDATRFPHVWLKASASLQFGVYPKSCASYDLATEELNFFDQVNSSESIAREPNDSKKHKIKDIRHLASRQTDKIDLRFDDITLRCASATQALLRGLEEIERRRPGTLDALSEKKSRTKRPVHRDRNALYDLESQTRYAEQIKTGHWVGTNNKRHEALNVLRSASTLAEVSLSIE